MDSEEADKMSSPPQKRRVAKTCVICTRAPSTGKCPLCFRRLYCGRRCQLEDWRFSHSENCVGGNAYRLRIANEKADNLKKKLTAVPNSTTTTTRHDGEWIERAATPINRKRKQNYLDQESDSAKKRQATEEAYWKSLRSPSDPEKDVHAGSAKGISSVSTQLTDSDSVSDEYVLTDDDDNEDSDEDGAYKSSMDDEVATDEENESSNAKMTKKNLNAGQKQEEDSSEVIEDAQVAVQPAIAGGEQQQEDKEEDSSEVIEHGKQAMDFEDESQELVMVESENESETIEIEYD